MTAIFKTDDQRRQYFCSGYVSLTEFCEKAFATSELRLFEADPSKAYDGYVLSPAIETRKDILPAKAKLLGYAASLIGSNDPVYIEFGVRSGTSMRTVSSSVKQEAAQFFGLDTFTGLPDGWVSAFGNRGKGVTAVRPAGEMAVDRIPDISDRRVVLIKGLFQDTLPLILPHLGSRQLFVNYDGDTYTAALYGLTMLHPYMKVGDVVYFDEFVDEINEFAAFNDYVRSFYVRDQFTVAGRAYDAFLFRYA